MLACIDVHAIRVRYGRTYRVSFAGAGAGSAGGGGAAAAAAADSAREVE